MTPTTKLEAVNQLLMSIGESPVNTLEEGLTESGMATTVIDNISREIQSKGWWFNTELFTLTPDVNGNLLLPANTLKVDTGFEHIVARGSKLYNKVENTFTFTQAYPAAVVVGLDYNELPEVARHSITTRAICVFQSQTVGSTSLHSMYTTNASMAYAMLDAAELENGNYSLFDNPELVAMNYRRGR